MGPTESSASSTPPRPSSAGKNFGSFLTSDSPGPFKPTTTVPPFPSPKSAPGRLLGEARSLAIATGRAKLGANFVRVTVADIAPVQVAKCAWAVTNFFVLSLPLSLLLAAPRSATAKVSPLSINAFVSSGLRGQSQNSFQTTNNAVFRRRRDSRLAIRLHPRHGRSLPYVRSRPSRSPLCLLFQPEPLNCASPRSHMSLSVFPDFPSFSVVLGTNSSSRSCPGPAHTHTHR